MEWLLWVALVGGIAAGALFAASPINSHSQFVVIVCCCVSFVVTAVVPALLPSSVIRQYVPRFVEELLFPSCIGSATAIMSWAFVAIGKAISSARMRAKEIHRCTRCSDIPITNDAPHNSETNPK
jgi:flagellar biosynthesis protein FliR